MGQFAKQTADGNYDIIGTCPSLEHYVFQAVTGTATIAGFFVDSFGKQIGSSFTASVASNASSTFESMSGLSFLDPEIVGFLGSVGGASVYFGLSAQTPGAESLGTNYPVLPANGKIAIGRVSPGVAHTLTS